MLSSLQCIPLGTKTIRLGCCQIQVRCMSIPHCQQYPSFRMDPKSRRPSSMPPVVRVSARSTASPTSESGPKSARFGQGFMLLNSRQCLPMGYHLHEFESAALGTNFRSNCRNFDHWFASGCLFYAAVCHGPSAPVLPIAALVSVFIATKSSCERFIR